MDKDILAIVIQKDHQKRMYKRYFYNSPQISWYYHRITHFLIPSTCECYPTWKVGLGSRVKVLNNWFSNRSLILNHSGKPHEVTETYNNGIKTEEGVRVEQWEKGWLVNPSTDNGQSRYCAKEHRDLKKVEHEVFQRLQEQCSLENTVKTDVRFMTFQIKDNKPVYSGVFDKFVIVSARN